ncbi:MAG TPA: CDP-alcohol phosphatidyltransferase family protein [Candidatus Eisenbacteria bacterium]|nr:CDP-alcohol phosphatidyltransferase family protein [Candidatus Eisenbacteria bacterium]
MFAEDLLREVRRAGYTPRAFLAYIRSVFARVTRRLPLHAELVRSVAATSMLLFAVQFAGALTLSASMSRQIGVAYLVSSSAVLLLATFWLLAHVGIMQGGAPRGEPREKGADDSGPALKRLPLPVTLTLLRIVSIPAIVLLVESRAWSAATWLFAASALTDVLDGVLARAMKQESRVGKVIDPLADIAFNATVFVALARVGLLPWWVAALVLTRYGMLVFGTIYLYVFHGPVRIEPTNFGKLSGVVTTTMVGLLLLFASWGADFQQRFHEVFVVGLAALSLATILQVVFIGLANKKAAASEPDVSRSKKVVGDVRWPRR